MGCADARDRAARQQGVRAVNNRDFVSNRLFNTLNLDPKMINDRATEDKSDQESRSFIELFI